MGAVAYPYILLMHSWLRYAVFLAGLWLLWGLFRATHARNPWSADLGRRQKWFFSLLNLQVLLGLLLYLLLSPFSGAAFAAFGAAMEDPQLRFWGAEHPITMLLAVAVAHVGQARANRRSGSGRIRTLRRMILLWLLLTLAAIPWPGLDIGRPLLRLA